MTITDSDLYSYSMYQYMLLKKNVSVPVECEESCQTCSPMIGKNAPPTIDKDMQRTHEKAKIMKGKGERNK